MAKNIDGPLYYERMGRTGPVMAFVHPNPMDQSCWIFQMAQMSTWFRCIAIDVPGYGRSPKCRKGVSMNDVAQGCWEAIDEIAPGEKAILVGCSVGSAIINYMHNLQPERTSALILSGTGYKPGKEFAHQRIADYKKYGIDFRWRYTFDDLSPAFRATPLATFFADMFCERNKFGDINSIIHQFEAHAATNPEDHEAKIACPSIILTGSEDNTHQKRLSAPGADQELRIEGAAGGWTRLPDRATLAVQPPHDRFSDESTACFRVDRGDAMTHSPPPVPARSPLPPRRSPRLPALAHGADLPIAHGADHRRHLGRRHHRYRRAPDRAMADRQARPAVRGREPHRRQQQHRHRGRGACRGRRLHAVHGQLGQRHQHDAVQESQLQLLHRPRAGRDRHALAAGSCRSIRRCRPRRVPSSSPTPRPIPARSTWARAATARPAHVPASCSK